jgi:hypothetical protein
MSHENNFHLEAASSSACGSNSSAVPPAARTFEVKGGRAPRARDRGREMGELDDVRSAERWCEVPGTDASLDRDLRSTASGTASGEGAMLFKKDRRRLSNSPFSALRVAKSLCFVPETACFEGLRLPPAPASDAVSCPLRREGGGSVFPLTWAHSASNESSRTAICEK